MTIPQQILWINIKNFENDSIESVESILYEYKINTIHKNVKLDSNIIKEELIKNDYKKLKKFYIQSGLIILHEKIEIEKSYIISNDIVNNNLKNNEFIIPNHIRFLNLNNGSRFTKYCCLYPFIIFENYNSDPDLIKNAINDFNQRYPLDGTSSFSLSLPNTLNELYLKNQFFVSILQPILCPYLHASTRYRLIMNDRIDKNDVNTSDEVFVTFSPDDKKKPTLQSILCEISGIEGIDDINSFSESMEYIVSLILKYLRYNNISKVYLHPLEDKMIGEIAKNILEKNLGTNDVLSDHIKTYFYTYFSKNFNLPPLSSSSLSLPSSSPSSSSSSE